MNKDLISFVWAVDRILAAVIGVIAATVFVYALIRRERMNRREFFEQRMRMFLRVLAVLDKESAGKACEQMINDSTAEEFVILTRLKGEIIPEHLTEAFQTCVRNSDRLKELERRAGRSWNKWARIQALLAVGAARSPGALALLTRALSDKDDDVAYYAMLSLSELQTPEASRVLLQAISGRRISGQKIASLLQSFPGRTVTDTLVEALNSPEAQVRFWAVRLLTVYKEQSSIDKIRSLAADGSADVRAAVCAFLGQSKDRQSRDVLISLLEDPRWFVRLQACRALYALLGTGSFDFIAPLLSDTSWMVRGEIKKSLSGHPQECRSYIVSALDKKSVSAADCVEVLENSGLVRQSLMDLNSPDARIKEEALSLIRLIKEAGGEKALERFSSGGEWS